MSTSTEWPASPVLQEVFEHRTVEKPNGEKVRNVVNISKDNSRALFDLIRKEQPETVVEIGMAHGVSTLSSLSALEQNGKGTLVSIDPYIGWPTGREIALHQIERAGLSARHRHLHECSYTGLPRLMNEDIIPDIVYIDGNHNFDYAFTDFFLADKAIRKGGIVAFNDAGWRSVFLVIKFLKKYRRYEELDVGLPPKYAARNKVFELVKRFEGRSSNDRYFRKLEDWEPDCDIMRIPGPA